jgi:dihydroorotate dehydrogenase
VERFGENVRRARYQGILGINIGKNSDTPLARAADDYLACFEKVHPYASYVTVNISSPNTKDLRRLQDADELGGLLAKLSRRRDELAKAAKRRVPLAVKIAPDLDDDQVAAIARLVGQHGINAVIATNTTVSRQGVEGLRHAAEAGGLSGAPIRAASTAIVRKVAQALGDSVPVIGVGGIMSADDAREKLTAGASLVQVYTGLVYRGPALVRDIVRGLAAPAARAA